MRPGLTILMPITAGGYDWDDVAKTGRGWDIDQYVHRHAVAAGRKS